MGRFQTAWKTLSGNWLLGWARKFFGAILALTAGNMLLALSGTGLAVASKEIVDAAVDGQACTLKRYALILVLLLASGLLLQGILNHLSETARARMVNEIRQETMAALLQKQYPAMESYHSGDLTNRLMSDVRIVCEGIFGILPPLFHMLTRLAAAAWVLFRIDWQFTCVLFAVGGGILLGAALLRRPMQKLHRDVQQEGGSVQALIQEMLVNLRLIKASHSEDCLEDKLQGRQNRYFAVQMKRKGISLLANAGLQTVFDGCWLYAVCRGCVGLLEGTVTYGSFTAMLQLVGQIQSPFVGMSGILQRFYGMTASAQRLEELLSLPQEETVQTVSLERGMAEGITLENVSFSYGEEPVLKNISGHIDAGDMVVITGPSGTGKSTLFLLMLGIYRPCAGQLLVTGRTDREMTSQTRKLFSYVPQGNTLFSGTLRENLTLFSPGASPEEIFRAAKIACVEDLILEIGLDTRIGERGLGLSEGQAQRIAIARGLLSNAPFLLLDEITSALDARTEAQVLRNLAGLPDRTCLIVTHRTLAMDFCSKRLHIENGWGCVEPIVR